MKLTHKCPKCGKDAKIQSEFPLGKLINYVYQCGHIELREKIQIQNEISSQLNEELKCHEQNVNIAKNISHITEHQSGRFAQTATVQTKDELEEWYSRWDNESGNDGTLTQVVPEYIHPSFKSVNGVKCAYEFQRAGIEFAEKTQLNCLISDAMGLGKTIQALITLKRNHEVAYPCAIFVRGATLFQWAREFHEWVSEDFTSCIPITNRIHIIPGFNVYILSMDMLAKDDIIAALLRLKLKAVVIDECQNFKNPNAKRTKNLIRLLIEGDIKYKIALSGTPIKNYAIEYFTILNILAPGYFYSLGGFKKEWLDWSYKKINPLKLDEFKDLISKWVLRRERHEVLKNLPSLTRDYQIIEIDDLNIKNSYNHTLDLFSNWLKDQKNNHTGIKSSELLGWLAKLRAITGQAKCKVALEWIKDFLESTDESLSVGIQHHSVRDTLYYVLKSLNLNPLKLSGEDSVYAKNQIVRDFTEGNNRVLVINMLAGGVGLNLQTCANALVLEREWNSADEEQFEARFHRDGQKLAVTITYMIAKGTIDEYFHQMVETKRQILAQTGIGTNEMSSDLNSLLDLANIVVSHRI